MNNKTRRLAMSISALAAAGALVAGCSSDGSASDAAASVTSAAGDAAATVTSAAKDAGEAIVDAGDDAGKAMDKAGDKGDATLDGPDGQIDVQREIADKYAEIGGPVGDFGTPVGEQESGPDGGAYVTFQRGTIFWSPDTDAHFVSGAILTAFNDNGGLDEIGYPTSDPKDDDGGKVVDFQNGKISEKDGKTEVKKN